jgi:hypothetical protein
MKGRTIASPVINAARMTQPSFQSSIIPEARRLERCIPSMLTLISGAILAGNKRINVPRAHPSAAVMLRPLVRSKAFKQTGQTARLRGANSGNSSNVPQSAQAIIIAGVLQIYLSLTDRIDLQPFGRKSDSNPIGKSKRTNFETAE